MALPAVRGDASVLAGNKHALRRGVEHGVPLLLLDAWAFANACFRRGKDLTKRDKRDKTDERDKRGRDVSIRVVLHERRSSPAREASYPFTSTGRLCSPPTNPRQRDAPAGLSPLINLLAYASESVAVAPDAHTTSGKRQVAPHLLFHVVDFYCVVFRYIGTCLRPRAVAERGEGMDRGKPGGQRQTPRHLWKSSGGRSALMPGLKSMMGCSWTFHSLMVLSVEDEVEAEPKLSSSVPPCEVADAGAGAPPDLVDLLLDLQALQVVELGLVALKLHLEVVAGPLALSHARG
eukprot:scaffold407_cov251-Pinguiococcus_pyrenoidosus.AAC.27